MDPAPVIYLPPPLDLPLADVVVNDVVDGDDGDDPMEGVEEDYEEDGAVDAGGGTPSEDGECAAADVDIDSGDSDVTHGIIFFHCTCFFLTNLYKKMWFHVCDALLRRDEALARRLAMGGRMTRVTHL